MHPVNGHMTESEEKTHLPCFFSGMMQTIVAVHLDRVLDSVFEQSTH